MFKRIPIVTLLQDAIYQANRDLLVAFAEEENARARRSMLETRLNRLIVQLLNEKETNGPQTNGQAGSENR